MSVADTSKAAFAAIKPDLKGRRLDVYLAVKEMGEASNRQIARHLNWEINRVTGRVHELVDMGWLVLAYKAKSVTGQTEKVWRPNKLEQTSLLEQDCHD